MSEASALPPLDGRTRHSASVPECFERVAPGALDEDRTTADGGYVM
jgi:hypothetical protein